MKLLKSLDELLYEIVSWLVFYPVTFWRILRSPKEMMRYADLELADRPADQYTETLSPPLFLLLSLLIAHGSELALARWEAEWVRPSLLESDSNLLIFRAVMFSIFPLLMSVQLLRRRGLTLNRETLRAPFYSQCYAAAPFALALSFAGQAARLDGRVAGTAALLIVLAAVAWYVTLETRWFKTDLGMPAGRALLVVSWIFLQAVITITFVTVLIVKGLGG